MELILLVIMTMSLVGMGRAITCPSPNNYGCLLNANLANNQCSYKYVFNGVPLCCSQTLDGICSSGCPSTITDLSSGLAVTCPAPASVTVGTYCGADSSSQYLVQIVDTTKYVMVIATGNNDACSAEGTYIVSSSTVAFSSTSSCSLKVTSMAFSSNSFSGTVTLSGSSKSITASSSACGSKYFGSSGTYSCTKSTNVAQLVTSSSSLALTTTIGSISCTMSGYYVLASDSTVAPLLKWTAASQCSNIPSPFSVTRSNLDVWTVTAGATVLKLSTSGCVAEPQPQQQQQQQQPAQDSSTPSSSSKIIAIVGGVVGGVIVLGIVVGVIVYFTLIHKPAVSSDSASCEMLQQDLRPSESAPSEMLYRDMRPSESAPSEMLYQDMRPSESAPSEMLYRDMRPSESAPSEVMLQDMKHTEDADIL